MKKQKVQLGKKVFLNKETIVALHNNEQQNVLGGADLPQVTVRGNTCASCWTAPTCGNADSCGVCEMTKNPTCYPSAYCGTL
jgi:hypothetical protein